MKIHFASVFLGNVFAKAEGILYKNLSICLGMVGKNIDET